MINYIFIKVKAITNIGLNILYRTLTKEYEIKCGEGKIFAMIHAPGDIPHFHYKYIQLQLNEIARITVRPKLTKISKGLEKLTPDLYVIEIVTN